MPNKKQLPKKERDALKEFKLYFESSMVQDYLRDSFLVYQASKEYKELCIQSKMMSCEVFLKLLILHSQIR